jgi:hypothetical protein
VFRTLYGRLAAAALVLFVALGALVVYAFNRMLEESRLVELATWLGLGGVAFALASGFLVFTLLTRRVMQLADVIERFRDSGFRDRVRVPFGDPAGDEIDRLAATFQELSDRMVEQLFELEQTGQRRRELLANVSHDLRTPLTSMHGYLETLLLKEGALSPEERRNLLMIAARNSEALRRLVGELFDLSKLEANEIRPDREAFLLPELVQDVAQKFALGAERKGVRIDVHAEDSILAAHADIGLIERVLANLIENAIRHTPAGGSIRIGLTRQGERLRTEVTDTGAGIAPAELPHIFDRYYRAARHGSDDGAGTGLGLAIARRIVQLHDGQIEALSSPGTGTTFRFDLPAA